MEPLMTMEDVLAVLGVGRTTLDELRAAGKFPPGRRLDDSGRRLRWTRAEVATYIEAMPRASGGEIGGRP